MVSLSGAPHDGHRPSSVRGTMPPMRAASLPRPVLAGGLAAFGWLAAARSVAGVAPAAPPIGPTDPPTVLNLVFGWSFEPFPTLGIVAALLWWRWAVVLVPRALAAE